MNGRWTLTVARNGTVIFDKPKYPGEASVPVVPCDDNAITRATKAYDEHRWPQLGWHADTDTYAVYFLNENRPDVFKVVEGYASIDAAGDDVGRLVAVAVLRAAGEASYAD